MKTKICLLFERGDKEYRIKLTKGDLGYLYDLFFTRDEHWALSRTDKK